ncbi:hydrogenase expression/formation protein [Thiocapsa roseopersicina]|uniref:Hydrogenase-1 operon protein HyaF n=1 Tax=Thiocapsa roseopersicina TaxID=1058 RepID=A0A1H2R1E8_THIRO|nr:hydrogenase expression/formation protein [Thiocapsa roseopersicina]SDW12960.1 hydrogenase-1 operon protein HyaF [Thiocapsa roseopersicina]
MSLLDQIPVIVESGSAAPESDSHPQGYGNSEPILHEVRHALARLISTGETTKIDLKAMPFGPGDLEHLLSVLGTGEVQATIEALGPTRIQETAVAGVWLVDYLNSEAHRLALHLEIATVPEILCPQPQDLNDAIAALDARLNPGRSDPPLAS